MSLPIVPNAAPRLAALIVGVALLDGGSPVRAQIAEAPPLTVPADPQPPLEEGAERAYEQDEHPTFETPPTADQIGRALQDVFDRILVPRSRFTNGARVRQTFRSVVAEARNATVHVRSDGKRVALGGVVGPDGWVLTKASLARGELTCRLTDGRELPARVVGVDRDNDLAMLKIEATGLPTLDLSGATPRAEQQSTVSLRRDEDANPDENDSDEERVSGERSDGDAPDQEAGWNGPQDGDWVATVGLGTTPEAIGVVSVSPREIPSRPGRLGIEMDTAKNGSVGVKIKHVTEGSAAESAGLQAGDLITVIDGVGVDSPERLKEAVTNRSPGDAIRVTVVRGDKVLQRRAILSGWEPNFTERRAYYQNNLGGELSERRFGFKLALQHDTVLEPRDCGGPLVDLDGRVVGFNISRAGRTESYALPVSLVRDRLYDLMSGRLAPATVDAALE